MIFPLLALIISGGHTEFVVMKNHINYQVIGETVDDALGESLDKAARMLTGVGYPGGPVIERLAKTGNPKFYNFPRPMRGSGDLNLSFSGLKTSLYYYLKNISDEQKLANINHIAASYQQAAFDTILLKLEKAIIQTKINHILVGGGVIANIYLKNLTTLKIKQT